MKTEKSCGAVVFTEDDGDIRYVIIRSKNGIYGFPKGHQESTESETETALREVREETGLDVTILDGFRAEDEYAFMHNGECIYKHIVYFLAHYSNQIPRPQESELDGIFLMDFQQATAVCQFESAKQILTHAHHFLTH